MIAADRLLGAVLGVLVMLMPGATALLYAGGKVGAIETRVDSLQSELGLVREVQLRREAISTTLAELVERVDGLRAGIARVDARLQRIEGGAASTPPGSP